MPPINVIYLFNSFIKYDMLTMLMSMLLKYVGCWTLVIKKNIYKWKSN